MIDLIKLFGGSSLAIGFISFGWYLLADVTKQVSADKDVVTIQETHHEKKMREYLARKDRRNSREGVETEVATVVAAAP